MKEGAPRNNNFEKKSLPVSMLADEFKHMLEEEDAQPFIDLEAQLEKSGFTLALDYETTSIFNNSSLLCRSEEFTRAIDLVTHEESIVIDNTDRHANMCTIASGEGMHVAMIEGFSGKDVGGIAKVVLTFSRDHLDHAEHPKNLSRLAELKPETARVAIAGSGEITSEDVKMISFRFPIRFFPEYMRTEKEQEQIEEDKIHFIVRHYLPHKGKAAH